MDADNPFVNYLTRSALAEHSSEGEESLIDAGQRFLMVRLFYERTAADSLTIARFEELSREAWVVFVQSSLQSYITWLDEASGAPTDNHFEEILQHSWVMFENFSEHLKEELLLHGVFTE